MIVLKIVAPDTYRSFRAEMPSFGEVQDAFRVTKYDEKRFVPVGTLLWKFICVPDELSPDEAREARQAFGSRAPSIHDNFLRYISEQYVEAFQLTLLDS